MTEERVLILSHGHPDFSLGGAEIAAHAHWSELRRRGMDARLVCRVDNPTGHVGSSFLARSSAGDEYLFTPPGVDHFCHSQPHRKFVLEDFRSLLESYRPTVVHFHHFVHLGLELIREVRNYSASVVIVLTLHEFLAICHAQGQMLKTNGALCLKSGPLDCHRCFPDRTPQDFFLRELFVKSFLELVDVFVSPSHFLIDRFVAWGLPKEKIVMIENGQHNRVAPDELGSRMPDAQRTHATRFAVLGQLSRYKGTIHVVEAVRLLPRRIRKAIKVEIHGSMQYAEEDFKNRFAEALKEVSDVVRLCGPYLPQDAGEIIRRNGWLIVPSIWWENSPLVIQESFAAGRPVLCGNIGGMAEKVQHGVNGFHFRVGSASDLAARMEECATNPELWEQMRSRISQPPTIQESVDQLLSAYATGRERMLACPPYPKP